MNKYSSVLRGEDVWKEFLMFKIEISSQAAHILSLLMKKKKKKKDDA